jgi:hypothetical protein
MLFVFVFFTTTTVMWLQPFVHHSSGQLPLPHLSLSLIITLQSKLILYLAACCKANLRLLSLASFSC